MNATPPAIVLTRVREIFLAALDLDSPTARTNFLDDACLNDTDMRRSVEELLEHHWDDAFLESPAAPASTVNATERPGDTLGRYRLVRMLGEGGCGVVHLAEQVTPIRREVALKILKPGMDTRSVIARFEQERQALALMDHPNIARVFDAGSTTTGRPFFVMELVRGVKITDFCDAQNLTTRERLELFTQACHAIHHAHQKGVIHRDVKPSNILVTLHDGTGVPKVIDFGIAKAIGRPLTDQTLFTDLRAFMGTPAYTSPEQAELSGVDVDTRTDIYSLGVLLYELLTNTTPFDPKQLAAAGLDELRRTIRDTEPERPSTRLRTLAGNTAKVTAQHRSLEPAHLIGLVKGDLDWIVMKCLEKDRTRRYDSAAALAADVRRYLDHEPVLARPPSNAYRFRKFARRHRGALATATAVGLSLIVGIAASTSLAFRATHAEHVQSQLREQAEAARAVEVVLRQEAEAQELSARRRAYAADINLLQQALTVNNLGRARQVLDAQRPRPGQTDLRGWEWRYLWQLCQSEAEFSLCQRSNEVHTLAASSDGQLVATAEEDGRVSVWRLKERIEVFSIALTGGRNPVAFSPTAPVLAIAGRNRGEFRDRRGQVRLWDAAAQQFTATLQLSAPCRALAFSKDGRTLTVFATDGVVTHWDPTRSESFVTTQVSLDRGDGRIASISPDLRRLGISRAGGRLEVFDLVTGTARWSALAADEQMTTMAFSPDGRWLATGAGFVESKIRLWDVASGRELARLDGHRTWVSDLDFWPDGSTLASASADQTIALWDLAPLKTTPASAEDNPETQPPSRGLAPLIHPRSMLRGHRLEVWSLALLPDQRTLVSGAKDGSVLVWDTTQPTASRTHVILPGRFQAWAFTGVPAEVVTLDADSQVLRWTATGAVMSTPLFSTPTNLLGPRFSPSGKYLVGGVRNGPTRVWSVTPGSLPRELTYASAPMMPVGFQADSDHLVTQAWPTPAYQEWDLESGKLLRTWQLAGTSRFPFGHSSVAGRNWFVRLADDGSGQLLHLQTSREATLDLDVKQITAVALSPTGDQLAVVSRYGTGGLWDIPTGVQRATYSGVLQAMASVSFSPDGQRLAIGSDGAEAVKVWDLASHLELLTLAGEGSGFGASAFSTDGTLLAASNRDGCLHVWRAPTWAEINDIETADR